MQEMKARPLGQEDLLEKWQPLQYPHAWRIPWTEGHGRLQSVELQNSGHNLAKVNNNKKYKYTKNSLIRI